MTTRSLFIAFNVVQASAFVLSLVIAVQLVRAKLVGVRRTWLRRSLIPPALYIFSFPLLSAGFVLMGRDSRLSFDGIAGELFALVNEPGLVWQAALPVIVYALVIAIASVAGERRLQTSRV